jgi:PAS domain S-box-containing protein
MVTTGSSECARILYVANERSDAQKAAGAFCGVASNVVVLWASNFEHAAQWVRENRSNVAALVVESLVNGQSCTSFLEHVRGLGLDVPTVVITPEGAAPLEGLSEATAAERVAKSDTLFNDLPAVVMLALEKRRAIVPATVSEPEDPVSSREREQAALLADAIRDREALGQKLKDTLQALQRANDSRAADASAADERFSTYQAQVDTRLAAASKAKTTLELRVSDVEAALRQREEHWSETKKQLEATIGAAEAALRNANQRHATELERHRAESDAESTRAAQTFDELREQLSDAATAFEALEKSAAEEHQAAAARYTELEELIQTERATRVDVEHALARAEAALETAKGHESELVALLEQARSVQATLELRQAESAAALKELDERGMHDRLQATERQAELEVRLEHEVEKSQGLEQELAAARSTCDEADARLRAHVATISGLHEDGARLTKELQRARHHLDQLPLAMCLCARDGRVIYVNPAFATLVGHDGPETLLNADLQSVVFESKGELAWLIERCLKSRERESIETRWKAKNGGRLFVRLTASISAAGDIDIVAEDVTMLRALQKRLDQAQRMEAVGRLASEVAVTCGNLLRDVNHDGQQWLVELERNSSLRRRGEMLLAEVTRAASFLRQLDAYGDEQVSALEPADLNQILCDLGPVLKQVLGEHITLVLPKGVSRVSSPLNLDVKSERIERLLVNLASYGRERMPHGGHLVLDLATVEVDRDFIDKYPNVRQGAHVLITVTEVRQARRAEAPLGLRGEAEDATTSRAGSEKPGVDLGALQGLIRECGGHLWMEVQQSGAMVVKIHLPLRAPDESTSGRAVAVRAGRAGAIGKWFQH